MPTPRIRVAGDGTPTWQVRFRTGGRGTPETSRTFTDDGRAIWFCDLIAKLGAAEAVRILDKRIAAVGDPRESWTVKTWCEQYVDNKSGITAGTRGNYRSYIRNDLGKLAELPLEAVDQDAVAAWVNKQEKAGSTAKTIKNKHGFISGAFRAAVDRKLMPSNPCHGVRLPSSTRRAMTFLTHDEYRVFLGCFDPHWQPLVATLFATGARWSEATALRVSDVDVSEGTLSIERAWKRPEKAGQPWTIGPPKSQKSVRRLVLASETIEILKPLVIGREPDELIFVNRLGNRVQINTFRQVTWNPAVNLANGQPARLETDKRVGKILGPDGEPIEPLEKPLGKKPRVHDSRHTCASWLLAAGVPATDVQEHMGHESLETTIKLYRHAMPSAGEQIRAAISSAVSKPRTRPGSRIAGRKRVRTGR